MRDQEETKKKKIRKNAESICVIRRNVVPLCAFSWSGQSVSVREQKNEGTSANSLATFYRRIKL